MSPDRVSHIWTAAFFSGIFLGMLFYRAALGVPTGAEKPIDPCGSYVSHVGDDTTPRYKVLIWEDKGLFLTAWGAGNQTHYRGILTVKEGVWTETYDDAPGLNRCGPWTWKVVNREPLAFEDLSPKGWTLTVAPADF